MNLLKYHNCHDVLSAIGWDKLQQRELSIFCGAGISLASGLPLANDLKVNILRLMSDVEEDISSIMASKLPFEAFLEIIFSNYYGGLSLDVPNDAMPANSKIDTEDTLLKKAAEAIYKLATVANADINTMGRGLLALFADKRLEPTTNHDFIAKLAKYEFLKTIVTSNFDCLIEIACLKNGLSIPNDIRVAILEEELERCSADRFSGTSLFKIHGSADNINSVRTSLQQIADKNLSKQREAVIDLLFCSGSHSKVLVLGYSFSDIYDLVPAIQSLKSSTKDVLIVNHTDKHCWAIESISDKFCSFSNLSGYMLTCNTDDFVLCFGLELLIDDFYPHPPRKIDTAQYWKEYLHNWGEFLKNDSNTCHSAFLMGSLLGTMGNYKRAIYYYEKCRDFAFKSNNDSILSVSYGNLAVMHGRLGEMTLENDYAQKARHLSIKNKDRREEANNISRQASLLIMTGKMNEAEQYNLQALEIADQIDDKQIQAQCHCNLANIMNHQKKYSTAEEHGLKALELSEAFPSPGMMEIYCRTNAQLCMSFAARGELKKAREYGKIALQSADNLGSDGERAIANISLGVSLAEAGDTETGIDFLKKALPKFQKVGNVMLEGVCCTYIGKFIAERMIATDNYKRDDEELAETSLARAMKIVSELGIDGAIADVLMCRGVLNTAVDKYDEALADFNKAIVILNKTNRYNDLMIAYKNISIIYTLKKNFAEADTWRSKADSLQTRIHALGKDGE